MDNLRLLARELRKNPTKQERRLWYDFLSQQDVHWCRQIVIENYIVDFCCRKIKLVIEIDGTQHYTEKGCESDRKRTEIIEEMGFRVIRFSNDDINNNFCSVCEEIAMITKEQMELGE